MMDTLKELEAGYFDQPRVGQMADLKRINEIRQQLGLPLVDDKLREPQASKKQVAKKPPRDLTKAREIYAAFKEKKELLKKHQEYAERVIKATEGYGMTPVEPLATMGCGGGALLCDHCGKPIILETAPYYNVPVDVAWGRQPEHLKMGWKSYIKGGMVVELQSNYTVRIYHGYIGSPDHCCEIASREDKAKRDAFVFKIDKQLQDDFLEVIIEFNKYEVYNELVNLMFSYDPGFGVNKP